MRFLVTSFTALLTLAACGPGVMSAARGGDAAANAGTSVGTAGTAGAPALPPPPVPASVPTLAPAPRPVPVSIVAPGPVSGPAPAGQAPAAVGYPGVIQTPLAAPSANAAVAANPNGDQWRYRWHGGKWWYWTTENRWVYRNGNEWTNYEPAAAFVPDPNRAGQPANGYYGPNPYGYYSSPYGYSTGYGGYYNYGPGYRGGYYGPGAYYGQSGISIGLGFGRGIRIGF